MATFPEIVSRQRNDQCTKGVPFNGVSCSTSVEAKQYQPTVGLGFYKIATDFVSCFLSFSPLELTAVSRDGVSDYVYAYYGILLM